MSDISEEEMFWDYNLWLVSHGYIDDNEYAQQEYSQWKKENGYID